MDTWMGKMFNIAEQSSVLKLLNKLFARIGIGEDSEPVGKPTLSHQEFIEKVDGLIYKTAAVGQGEQCLIRPQLQQ